MQQQQSEDATSLPGLSHRTNEGLLVHAVVVTDHAGQIIGWNERAHALFGWRKIEVLGRSYGELLIPGERERDLLAAKRDEVRAEGISNHVGWYCRQDGSGFLASCIMLSRDAGQLPDFIHILQDRSDQDVVIRALRQSEAQFRLLIETIPQLVWRSLDNGDWDWAGPQWVAYTGQPELDSHGQGWRAMVHPDDQVVTLQAWAAAAGRGGLEVEHRLRRADGVYRWFQTRAVPLPGADGADGPNHWFGTSTDVDNVRQAEERIEFLAYHDVLTGAVNRALLQRVLEQVTGGGDRTAAACTVLYLDLDRLKLINDQFGHRGGDELLRQVVVRLQNGLREDGTVARIGGDEFVLVQPCGSADDAAGLAASIVAILSEPFIIEAQPLRVSVSIGVARFPHDAGTSEELLRRADLALYRAKAVGGSVRFYEPAMEAELRQRQALERDLRQAVERDELDMHYQPMFWTGSGELYGFEALARWTHPQRGAVPPGVFIPLAEECGLIVPLGARMLERACHTAAAWRNDHPIAVNLSPEQFRSGNIARQIAGVLAQTGLAAQRLELEVTEGLLMDDSEHVRDMLQAIKSLGVRIALDDFGTGYSSLGYLCRFPFDKVKIDQSFIRGLSDDPSARAVVRAIIALGHSLHMQVIAEGVETDEQLARLRELGCDQVQGYLLGRPASAGAAGWPGGLIRTTEPSRA